MKRGFTLIELLVVIAIISLLATIVITSLGSARLKGRDSRRVADIKELQLALALYYDANSTYPTALTALAPSYIALVPSDPVAGYSYHYAALGSGTSCTSYHLGATLESGANPSAPAVGAAAMGNCAGSPNDFSSSASASCPGDPAGGSCYDVKP